MIWLIYIALIIANRRSITQIPQRYRDAVVADLNAFGLNENGQPQVVQ